MSRSEGRRGRRPRGGDTRRCTSPLRPRRPGPRIRRWGPVDEQHVSRAPCASLPRGALLVALAGCGGDSVRPPVVVVTPAAGARGHRPDVVLRLRDRRLDLHRAHPLAAGRPRHHRGLDVPRRRGCTCTSGSTNCGYAQLAGQTCPFLLSSATQDPKPRVLYTDTLEPGTYYLVLYNVPRDPRDGHRQRQHGGGRAPARPDRERERAALDRTPSASAARSSSPPPRL